jgi:pyruvate, water dikinase
MNRPVPLEQASDARLFGGKSAQLGASLRAGLPVPPGWGLSVEFVDAVVDQDPETLEALALFLEDKPYPLAVRSSGIDEDATTASFAGQHSTELNRLGFEDVAAAIRLVWDSGESKGAQGYRARLGISGKARTGVTLQKMVFPDAAGVMFTRHPVTGASETLIEASWGLGEAIVQGLVLPDRFRLRSDGVLIEKEAGIKDVCITAQPGGGIEESPILDPARVNGFCLDDTQLSELVQLARACEKQFGAGRDIEWAVERGVLYLLQCRSITTGPPA